jgi:hypothetical protein
MLNKKLFYCFIVLLLMVVLFSSLFIFSVNISLADEILPQPTDSNGCPSGYSGNCGDYTLNDFIQIAVNVANWILSIVGSLALLMFIYGGVMFLISGGNQERVAKAKQIILGAVLGLVIVFASYMIIVFVAMALGIETPSKILQSGWL